MQLPSSILGHEEVLERFRRSLEHGRLASTFLFIGPPGIGKRTTAMHLAQCLLCEATPSDQLVACQTCPGCQQVAAESHPDLVLIRKPVDRSFIPVELFIGDREHRMREGLCHDIALKPFRAGRKVAIIDDADYLNQEGANCLLKTLEEPPENSVIILIGTSQQRQLPTIRSRCQIIRFSALDEAIVTELLERHGYFSESERGTLAQRAGGSLIRALEIADAELEDALQNLVQCLSRRDFDAVALSKTVTTFVDAAGKEAPVKRARLKQIVKGVTDFYYELMRQAAGADPSGIKPLDQSVQYALQHWQGGATTAAACVDRCMDAVAQIDANANLPTLVPSWLDDLAELSPR